MTKEPEALRLAKSLEQLGADIYFTHRTEDLEAAAIELRRLHEVNAELLGHLHVILDQVDYTKGRCGRTEMVGACLDALEVRARAAIAIAKATGEKE